ncbi:MAG: sulfotransferase [Vicinamibacterales bacterium]
MPRPESIPAIARHYLRALLAGAARRSPFDRTVLLAGSGRSGTTWIGNLIAHRHDYRVLFEPVHHQKVPEFRQFHNRQYLRPGDSDPTYLDPMTRLLRGRIRHPWMDGRNQNRYARKLLVKDIRTNLLLKWVAAQRPDIRIILLLRHPCAVAASRVKLGWGPFADAFLAQPAVMEDFLDPFRDLLETRRSAFVGNVVSWCAENYVPLKQFAGGGIHLCYYEHVLLEPAREVARLLTFVGEPLPDDLGAVLSAPSDTNWNRSHQPLPAFDQWKNEVDAGDRDAAVRVLEQFGMQALYDQDGRPGSATLTR